ncbi:hypothetical protein Ancab_009800 [Ancistrocladus abbreviatus]
MFSGGKMEEGWDLNAVVRGYVGTGKAKTTVDSSPNFSFMDFINEIPLDDFGTPIGLPSLFEDNNSNPFDELGNCYKPFYPDPPPLQHVLPASPPSMASDATLGTVGILNRSLFPQQIQQQALLLQQQKQQQEQQQQQLQQEQEQEQQQQQHQRQFLAQQLQHHHPQRPTHYRCRKRKSEQKRTTYQVTAENIISTDHWAWRKYGQKPIKGSPYPRNYYRCSSSKRCTARKQVEKSPTQPNLYLVTYTGDHCHPRPTHRNSLAGSSRTKFYAANKHENFETKSEAIVSTSSLVPKIATPSPLSPSPSLESSLSPNTPSATTTTELDDVDANNNSNGNNNEGDVRNVGVAAVGSEDNFENELEVFVNGATKMEKTSDENSSFRIEYNDVLIPNLMVDEDVLSMKEQGMASVEIVVGSAPGSYGSVNIGGRDVGNSVPPWNPIGCSANAGGAA